MNRADNDDDCQPEKDNSTVSSPGVMLPKVEILQTQIVFSLGFPPFLWTIAGEIKFPFHACCNPDNDKPPTV